MKARLSPGLMALRVAAELCRGQVVNLGPGFPAPGIRTSAAGPRDNLACRQLPCGLFAQGARGEGRS